ncbi:PREDICTED: ral guanine nucleotide dissociation stimulator-like [Chrysochloris asiatica]|uniref:Ral guanine nucleotide dissociation stimulator-like n=1 Tax=Chrysochloris asiatica TaxID=185453 RepID=A0A9B0U327_CHRAS|nr:PREDICTED: ral guanine nucleotide dissociation stimulator-like [Chrysochloris asiatica]
MEKGDSISSILGMWLDQCPDDFYELPDFPCLHLLVDYIGLNMPGSVLEQRAQLLLKNMKDSKPIESEAKGLELHTAEVEDVELEIAPQAAPETAAAVTAEEEPVPAPNPEPPCPSFVDTTSRLREEELSILTFPPKLVAEQLTRMDAELFKKVVPYHCLGSIWSQRNKKGKENLAPTIRATITQFNNVVHCVITTCLGDKSMKAPDRARVVEHWIEVARECLIHRNFSSLHAILSALQSSSIHRLKETWGEVSSRSFQTFLKLCKKNTLNKDLLIKKKMSKFSILKMNLRRAQDGQQEKEMDIFQGTVPYLGVFLTDLVMLDTAQQDFLDGGLINFQKRRKEFSVLQEIKLLQESCQHYTIVSQEQFGTWFQDFDNLSENESYNMSCELEPPAQVASNTHSSYKKT